MQAAEIVINLYLMRLSLIMQRHAFLRGRRTRHPLLEKFCAAHLNKMQLWCMTQRKSLVRSTRSIAE